MSQTIQEYVMNARATQRLQVVYTNGDVMETVARNFAYNLRDWCKSAKWGPMTVLGTDTDEKTIIVYIGKEE